MSIDQLSDEKVVESWRTTDHVAADNNAGGAALRAVVVTDR